MADAIALPQNPPLSIPTKFVRLIPGVALLAVIGLAGKFLEKNINLYAKSHHWTIPNIEYVLWAILIGLAISKGYQQKYSDSIMGTSVVRAGASVWGGPKAGSQ